jgi:hypothetical protein
MMINEIIRFNNTYGIKNIVLRIETFNFIVIFVRLALIHKDSLKYFYL